MQELDTLLAADTSEITRLIQLRDAPFQDVGPALPAHRPDMLSTLSHWVDSNGLLVVALGLGLGVFYLLIAGIRVSLSRQKQAVAGELARADGLREALQKAEAEKEQLLALLRQRDRFMTQREAVVSIGECFVATWDEQHWKAIARMQLDLTKAVRPLLYADLRLRIKHLSTTYAGLPGPALLAAQRSAGSEAVVLASLLPELSFEEVFSEPEMAPVYPLVNPFLTPVDSVAMVQFLSDEPSNPVAIHYNFITTDSTKKQVADTLHFLWNASPAPAREATDDDNLNLVAIQQQAKQRRAQRRAALLQKKPLTPNE